MSFPANISLPPWSVDPDLSNIGKGGVTTSDNQVFGDAGDYEPGYFRIEDARLISAAPDLYEALKAIMAHDRIRWMDDSGPANEGWQSDELIDLFASADKALAKAEGRE